MYEEAQKFGAPDWEIMHNKGLCYMYLKQYDRCARTGAGQACTAGGKVEVLWGLCERCVVGFHDARECGVLRRQA